MRGGIYKPIAVLAILFAGFASLAISLYACDGWYRRGGVTPSEFLAFFGPAKVVVLALGLLFAIWLACRLLWLLAGLRQRPGGRVRNHEA